MLVALGSTTIVTASWARDFASPRVTLLGAERGIALLITSGSSRVLLLGGSNPTELGNAIAKARHPGLDRIDVMIVSGSVGTTDMTQRSIRLLAPRMIITVGTDASLQNSDIVTDKTIDRATEIELSNGVVLTIDVWSSSEDDTDETTWAVKIERGGASVLWVADRGALEQNGLPETTDIIILGNGKPNSRIPFPRARVVVAAGESISGPEMRSIAGNAIGPDVEIARLYAGEITRIDLAPQGIRSIDDAIPVASPAAT